MTRTQPSLQEALEKERTKRRAAEAKLEATRQKEVDWKKIAALFASSK